MTTAYLYLTQASWAEAWTAGGQIPVSPASKYWASERAGTQTPDEIIQRREIGVTPGLRQQFNFGVGTLAKFSNCKTIDQFGNLVPLDAYVDIHVEDSLILSLSTVCAAELMRRLGKVAVVRIDDVPRLLSILSEALGVTGSCVPIGYTKSVDRSHSVKGWEDHWQRELRLLWFREPCEETWVTIPPGVGELLDPTAIPEKDQSPLPQDVGSFFPGYATDHPRPTHVASVQPMNRHQRRREERQRRMTPGLYDYRSSAWIKPAPKA